MKIPFAAVLAVSLAACASRETRSQTKSAVPVRSGEQGVSVSTATVRAARRVTLPYTFTRSGVEIRVNSIELADNRVVVNIAMQETRGQAAALSASALMQVFSTSGNELPYLNYNRAGDIRSEAEIPMAAHEQYSIALFYQPVLGSAGAPGDYSELRFPTGKYWSSQSAP